MTGGRAVTDGPAVTGVRALLLAALAGALLLTTGCGGGSSDGERTGRADGQAAGRTTGPSAPASPVPGAEKEADKEAGAAGKARPSGSRTSAPTVPKAELTPATGSFTKKQQRYLEGRVPEGIDPAAVVAGGEEICERITRTAQVDRDAVVDAVRSKEIRGAKGAVLHLCPQHKDLLTAAGR